uniref:Uncharacterized protein n=1 Tax=Leersia perrieri TaxID=77586 RepID=A0A0D9XPA0_9ORYZ
MAREDSEWHTTACDIQEAAQGLDEEGKQVGDNLWHGRMPHEHERANAQRMAVRRPLGVWLIEQSDVPKSVGLRQGWHVLAMGLPCD